MTTSGTPSGDWTDDERGDECGVDGHLDLAKTAAETDVEYIHRMGRHAARRDQERASAESAKNDGPAVEWDRAYSEKVGKRTRGRKRGRRWAGKQK